MQFIKEYVPDKRWSSGRRPVIVESNVFYWALWNITQFMENIFKFMRKRIESQFTQTDSTDLQGEDQ